MKKLFLVIATIAIVSACKKTNKQDEPTPVAAEKLCLLDSVTSAGGTNINFRYKNNVLNSVETGDLNSFNYYYSQTTFIDSSFKRGVLRTVKSYFLNDKKKATMSIDYNVENKSNDTTFYFYNLEGYLTKDSTNKIVKSNLDPSKKVIYIRTSSYTWLNGNIIREEFTSKEEQGAVSVNIVDYEYYLDKIDNSTYFTMQPNAIFTGKINRNLISQIKYKSETTARIYTYEFASDGRVVKLDKSRGVEEIETLHYNCK